MALILAFMLTLSSPTQDVIDAAINSFNQIDSYTVTLQASGGETTEEIKYYFKKPGYVRMEFITPYRGMILVYNPHKKKVRVRPFRFLKFFVLSLSPDNSILRSSRGHRVDKSDIGALLKKVGRLKSQGTVTVLKDETIGHRQAMLVRVKGEEQLNVDGVHLYHLWLDYESLLPLKASAYNIAGELIEEAVMGDLHINPEFQEDLFDL
jgi:outer membrane lipoprotein-sorting protein